MKFCQNMIWKKKCCCFNEKKSEKLVSQIKFLCYTNAYVIYEWYLGVAKFVDSAMLKPVLKPLW